MSENINYTYESKPVDIAILSVLDVTSDGKIVSAADWTALWNTVLMRINHLDKYCSDISTLIIRWQESITAFDKAMSDINAMFNTLSNSFIHYGEEAPTDDNVRLWVQPNSEVDDKSLVTKAELTAAITNSEAAIDATTDQTFNPESKNAQSGIAIDKYVTDNFSDIIIETSHSVNSPAEIDCCLKGQKIVGGNILGAEPQIDTGRNQLYLPHNPVIHFSPVNPIQNRTFIGGGITIEEAGTALHYAFAGDYNAAFNENATQIKMGQEYIMRFDVTCTYQNNPSKWGFGVFSEKQYSSAYDVATKSLVTVKEAGTGAIAYQGYSHKMSYTDFAVYSPMNKGRRYIIELVFTSSYSGKVYFGMRAEGAPITVDLMSCLFCNTDSLPMLVDQKINTNLLGIGNIYDSIDLVTGQKTQQIMIDALSFDTEQLVVNNYNKALPSAPAYFVSGTLEAADWIECVTPAAGTNNYKLSQPLSKGYIIYATRTPVTEQLELALPVVCTDEFEIYTSSDDNMVPYFQTSVDTKKSASSYLKKILNTIISMGGNI